MCNIASRFTSSIAQSAEAVKYTNWISAEGQAPRPNVYLAYDIKQSDI